MATAYLWENAVVMATAYLWLLGVFRAEHSESLAVRLGTGVIAVAEDGGPGGGAEGAGCNLSFFRTFCITLLN